MERISLRRLAKITEMAYQTLVYWQDIGVLVPREVDATDGNRSKPTAYYHAEDLFAVAVCADLQRQGVQGEALHKVCRFLTRANIEARLAAGLKYLVVANGRQVFNALPTAEFQANGRGPVSFVVVDLEQAQAAFRERLDAWERQEERKVLAKN
jgi:DNA-binding transcriptional MerR regulator